MEHSGIPARCSALCTRFSHDWLYRKDISPPAFVLQPAIWFSLDYLYLCKSTFLQTTGNEIRSEEHEIYIDFLAEKLCQVDCLLTDVVCEKEYSTRLQYSEYFTEGYPYLFFCEVNYSVESYNTSY